MWSRTAWARDDANTPTDDPGKENTPFTGHTTDTGTASGNDVDAGHILYFGAAAGENTKTFDPSVFTRPTPPATAARPLPWLRAASTAA